MPGPAIITAALNGATATKEDNPGIPISPEEIAAAAKDAWEAGAAIVHIHLRDERGRPTADLEVARRTIGLIEDCCGAIVQLSTAVGFDVPFEDRERLVEARPRTATLNLATMTFGTNELRNPPAKVRRLAARMLELEVKPELEIYDTGHLDIALSLQAEGLIADPLQLSIVLGLTGGAAATPANLANMVGRLPEGCSWQAIGIGGANLPMTAMGLSMGGDARTGMEDTLTLGQDARVESNAQLVERLVGVARSLEREPASAELAARRLGLKGAPQPGGSQLR